MSTFTIYTVSDPMVIGSAMTSMAMFFGQDSWVAGAIKTGLIISLIVILAQSVSSQKLRLDVMLLQLLVVWVMFIPKATVQIEQFDNSAPPRVVDGVPYAIALPATMAGAFAMYMTQKIETVMVNTDGNYLTVSGDVNPFAPARVLLSFTACAQMPLACLPRDIVETLRLGVRYCAGPSLTSSNNTTFAKSNHVFSDIAATFTQQGSTIIYDSTNPYLSGGGGGRSASCDEARAFIAGYEGQVISGTQAAINDNLTDLAQRAMIVNNKTATRSSGQIDLNQALTMVNMLTDSSTRVDELALFNVMTYSVADAFQENADSPIDTLIAARRDANLFAWAKTEANQAMLMSTAAPKFMDVLFFIFVACTPIVMFVVIANPSTGLKVAGSYALFGLWTQSWIPMMAIVTAWYQRELLSIAPPSFGVIQTSSSITPEYMSTMMQHVMTTTIAAGNMIQNAPYLMFAILSGSMFAMSNMIGKAMPSGGGADLQGGGGGGAGSGGLVGGKGSAGSPIMAQQAGLMSASNFLAGGMADGSSGPRADVGANMGGLADLSSGGGVSMAQSATHEANAATRNQIAKSAQQSLSDLSSMIESGGLSKHGEKLQSYMRNQGYDASYNASDNTMSINGQKFSLDSAQDRTTKATKGGQAAVSLQADALKAIPSLSGALAGGLGAGPAAVAGGFAAGQAASAVAAAAGIKLGATLSGFLATETADSQNVKLGGGMSAEKKNSQQQGDTFASKDGKSASAGFSGGEGGSYSNMGQRAKSISDNLTQLASQMKSLDDSDKMSTSASNTASGEAGVKIKGSDVVQNWSDVTQTANGGRNSVNQNEAQARVMDALGSAIDPAKRSQFESAMSSEYQKLAQSFGSGANKDQLAAAAAWRTLSQQSGSGDMNQRIDALNGMAHMAKAAGLGDLTQSLGAAAKAANLSADVNKAIMAQKGEVSSAVGNAVSRVDSGLSDKNVAAVQGAVGSLIDNGAYTSQRNIGAAASGNSGMPGEQAAARSSFERAHPEGKNTYPEMIEAQRRGVEGQAKINPQPDDAPAYIKNTTGANAPIARSEDARGPNSVPSASSAHSSVATTASGSSVSPGLMQGALNVSAPVTTELAQVLGKASDLGLSSAGSVAQFVTVPSSGSSGDGQQATQVGKPNAMSPSSTASSKPIIQKPN